jgi:branched-chain amino acid transport system ATP-binding protein
LAPHIVREVITIIEELASTNITTILVEQNAILALRICSRVYVLDDGKTAHEGTAEELTANEELKKRLLGI